MKEESKNKNPHETLIAQLIDLLNKGNAHVSLTTALDGIAFELLGTKPDGVSYSLWQLAEHIRIAQADILQFCVNKNYVDPDWPDDYWPKESQPASPGKWHECVKAIETDRAAFCELLRHAGNDLYVPFTHGTGQSLLKEALVLADHNSYHTGEIVLLRRLLGNWHTS